MLCPVVVCWNHPACFFFFTLARPPPPPPVGSSLVAALCFAEGVTRFSDLSSSVSLLFSFFFPVAEAVLRSGKRASDVLDPSTVNLAPVPDMYQAFMRTLLKPAPQQQQQQQRVAGGAQFGVADATLAGGGAGVGSALKGRKGKRGGDKGLVSPPSVMEEGLLSVLSKKLKA